MAVDGIVSGIDAESIWMSISLQASVLIFWFSCIMDAVCSIVSSLSLFPFRSLLKFILHISILIVADNYSLLTVGLFLAVRSTFPTPSRHHCIFRIRWTSCLDFRIFFPLDAEIASLA